MSSPSQRRLFERTGLAELDPRKVSREREYQPKASLVANYGLEAVLFLLHG